MHTVQRTLILGLLLLLGTPGCFNPDYGDGGFLCSNTGSRCPEGYHCAGGSCVRDGGDAGNNKGNCSITDAVSDVDKGAFRWSLVLNRDGQPHIYYVTTGKVIKEAVLDKTWSHNDIVLFKNKRPTGDHVAAAMDSNRQTVVVFANSGDSTDRVPRFIWRASGSSNWSEGKVVDTTLDLKTNGLAMASGGGETFLAATGEDMASAAGARGLHEVYRWQVKDHFFTAGPQAKRSDKVPEAVRISVGT